MPWRGSRKMHRKLRLAAGFVALYILGSSSHAGPREDCDSKDPDLIIRGCTRFIEIENKLRSSGKALAIAYNRRGDVYLKRKQLDPAWADFTAAIRIDPKYLEPVTNRGIIYHMRGDLDRAIAEHTSAIRIGKGDAAAYTNRGRAYKDQGR